MVSQNSEQRFIHYNTPNNLESFQRYISKQDAAVKIVILDQLQFLFVPCVQICNHHHSQEIFYPIRGLASLGTFSLIYGIKAIIPLFMKISAAVVA